MPLVKLILKRQAFRLFLIGSLLYHSAICIYANWPQFLGPGGLADAENQNIPVEFGPDKNLAWRVDLPKGHGSPIIWGNNLFVAGYRGENRLMLAIDRRDGTILWEQKVQSHGKEEFTHRLSSPAESTPCTDGERVYFYFGNYGLVALDLDGSVAWKKPMPRPKTGMGTGTSPVLIGNTLILNRDGTNDPCILAIDTKTGAEKWKHPRIGYSSTHSSPFVWRNGIRTEIIIAGTRSLVSLNPESGHLIWKIENMNGFPCTTPTGNRDSLYFASWSNAGIGGRDTVEAHFDDELVFTDEEIEDPELFFTRFDKSADGRISINELPQSRARDVFKWLDRDKNGYWETDEFSILTRPPGRGRNIMVAIKSGGEGLLNDTEFISWEWKKNLPYVASPLISKDRVYLVKSLGIITCLNNKTGEPLYSGERTGIKGEYFASPVLAGDNILLISSLGRVIVIKDNDQFQIQAKNKLDEEIVATPAIVDDTIYLRSIDSLWAFRKTFL